MNVLAFDEIIQGTGGVWYSPADLNVPLGEYEFFALHAVTSEVSGTSPTLSVTFEHSSDGQGWTSYSTFLNALPIVNDGSNYGGQIFLFSKYVRTKITLGGTNPKCRLKLYITARGFARAEAQFADV